jgi:sulfite exporter TauE/SafE
MAQELTLVSALLLGFFGSTHCVAMCGGIVAALNQALPEPRPAAAFHAFRPLGDHVVYSLGRVASYTTAGALAGSLGFVLVEALGPSGAIALRAGFGLLLVALGAALAGWWTGVSRIESIATHLWDRVSPLMRHFQPADRAWKLLVLGEIWGWLPCGLVYGVLAGAAASGSALRGALLMAAFGAGTLPTLLAAGAFALQLRRVTARTGVRWAAGGLVVAFGVWTLAGMFVVSDSGHGAGHGAGESHFEHRAPDGASSHGDGAQRLPADLRAATRRPTPVPSSASGERAGTEANGTLAANETGSTRKRSTVQSKLVSSNRTRSRSVHTTRSS